jgi:hypothetical protein
MRRLATATVIAAMLVVAFAGTAAAKGEAMAELDAPIPPDADPGTELKVGWRAWTPDGGTEWPFAGSPIFIRLISTDGTASTEVLGTENPRGSGHYLATISVPPGGVGHVEIGLLGESCVDGVCTRSDILFELPEVQRVPAPAVPVSVVAPMPAAPQSEPLGAAAGAAPSNDTLPLALAIVGGGVVLLLLLGLAGRVRASSGPAGVAAPAHAGLRGRSPDA